MFATRQTYGRGYEPSEAEIQDRIDRARAAAEERQQAAEPTEEPTIEEPVPTEEPAPRPRPAPPPAPEPNPRETFAGQLAGAHGAGGTGFQRFGTEGAQPFRTPDFYRGRRAGAPDETTLVRTSRGTPMAGRSFGGERDDEARAWRAAKMAAKLPF